jgi:telomerase reverse transcriptase
MTKVFVLQVFRWTLEQFVIPLLHVCFYVTETEFTGTQVVYYRKPVWTWFRSLSLQKLLLQQQYTELLSINDVTQRIEQQSMGISRLRLVPKETGVRPIATLSKSARVVLPSSLGTTSSTAAPSTLGKDNVELEVNHDDSTEEGRPTKRRKVAHSIVQLQKRTLVSPPFHSYRKPSTNSQLQEVFAVLRSEYETDTSLFGSGLDGLHQFYPKYRQFLSDLKASSSSGGHLDQKDTTRSTRLFFGSVDIKHCFDSINQEEMLKIVESILKKTEYCIQNHFQYRPYESMSRILKLKKTRVCKPEDLRPFPMIAEEMARSSHNTVYADMGNCSVVKKPRILRLLNEHLKSHLVVTADRIGDRFLLQSTGVPQGSTLSTLLCNFYYGKIEKMLLQDSPKQQQQPQANNRPPHTLLCRQVDDFLFVGTHPTQLVDFLVAMLRGDANLGVQVNHDKTRVSTTVQVHLSNEISKVLVPQNGTRYKFPWCGMVFHVRTGEVMVDYSRFYADKSGNSISIDRRRGPGQELLIQLKSFVRPRCIPILYDPSINRLCTQQMNFCQMMAFAAIKMIVYLEARSFSVDKENDNIAFVVTCIESTISYAGTLIRSRLDAANAQWGMGRTHQIMYLGWKAFRSVLVTFGKAPNLLVALDQWKTQVVPLLSKGDNDNEDNNASFSLLDRRCHRALRAMELRKFMA